MRIAIIATVRADVEEPQPARGRADALCEVHLRPGHLGFEQLAAADAQAGQHGEGEHDDPHAAEPLCELPPEQNRVVDRVDVDEDRRPRGREARHRLEERIDGPVELRVPREQVGQRAEHGRREPGQRDDEIALTEADRAGPPGRPLHDEAEPAHEGEGAEERPGRLAVPQRDGCGSERRRRTGT